MADSDGIKNRTRRFATRLSSNIKQPFLKKKAEGPGKPKAPCHQDAPTTTTSSEIANSTNIDAEMTLGVIKTEVEDEVSSPAVEGVIVPRLSADGDRESALPASDDDNVSMEIPPPDDISKSNIGAVSRSEVPSSLAREIPTTLGWSPAVASFDVESYTAALWDNAYDLLKSRPGAPLDVYERVIDQYLAQEEPEDQCERRPPSVTAVMGKGVSVSDLPTRRRQMARVIKIWLTDHDNKTAIPSGATSTGEATRSLRDILQSSLERRQYASLPWTTACLAVEVRPPLAWNRGSESRKSVLTIWNVECFSREFDVRCQPLGYRRNHLEDGVVHGSLKAPL